LTDGAQEADGSGIGGIVIPGGRDSGEWWCGLVNIGIARQWNLTRETNIVNIELFALWVTLHKWQAEIDGHHVVAWIDNQAAHAILCKGSATEDDTRTLVKCIWELVERRRMTLWLEWVESKANMADHPSRYLLAGKKEKQRIRELMLSVKLTQRKLASLPGYRPHTHQDGDDTMWIAPPPKRPQTHSS